MASLHRPSLRAFRAGASSAIPSSESGAEGDVEERPFGAGAGFEDLRRLFLETGMDETEMIAEKRDATVAGGAGVG